MYRKAGAGLSGHNADCAPFLSRGFTDSHVPAEDDINPDSFMAHDRGRWLMDALCSSWMLYIVRSQSAFL